MPQPCKWTCSTRSKSRNFERLGSLYHPDYVYMSGDGVEQKGAEAGVAVAETYTRAFPDMTFESGTNSPPATTWRSSS